MARMRSRKLVRGAGFWELVERVVGLGAGVGGAMRSTGATKR